MLRKNRIKYVLTKNWQLYNFVRVLYSLVIHPERFLKRKSFGILNDTKTVLIIRPNSEDGIQGLMSLFVQAARWLQYGDERGYISYVDYKTYKTQYYENDNNAWEFFFRQPDTILHDEAYKSKHVILSGLSLKKTVDNEMFRDGVFKDNNILDKSHSIIVKKVKLSDEANTIIESENSLLHVEDCIGIYLRGTDYVKLKPPGEFRQPEIKDVVKKIKEFTTTHPGRKLFLVTEDAEYYEILKKEFPELLCTVSFDSFVSGYDGKNYLSKTGLLEDDKKKRGMDYLVKIILLSRCKYLISSITMGSIAAYCFNGGNDNFCRKRKYEYCLYSFWTIFFRICNGNVI